MKFVFPESEVVRSLPWRKPSPPKKILLIRLHAFGDTVLAMPAAQHLKDLHPEIEMHLLVGEPSADLPRNMPAFSKVHVLKNARGGWKMGLDVLKILPRLLSERFDAVLDLQRNKFSKIVRHALHPVAWSEFDRFSKIHAVRRYQNTVNAIGLGHTEIGRKIILRDEHAGLEKLREAGWNQRARLVVLNPCGAFPTRQWGVEKYLAFARIWLETVDAKSKFLLLGLPAQRGYFDFLERNLGENAINLVGKTSVREMVNIVRRADLSLSDDGGLLHVSWVSHVPTIGFLGASPSYWGAPLGEKSFAFTSDDLPCGNCHRTDCIWDDNRCLARVSPEMAVQKARELLGI